MNTDNRLSRIPQFAQLPKDNYYHCTILYFDWHYKSNQQSPCSSAVIQWQKCVWNDTKWQVFLPLSWFLISQTKFPQSFQGHVKFFLPALLNSRCDTPTLIINKLHHRKIYPRQEF